MHISIRRAVAMALFGNLLSATSIAQQSPATATAKPHDHAQATGNAKEKVLPFPGALLTHILPP